jgi:peroxiredoxin
MRKHLTRSLAAGLFLAGAVFAAPEIGKPAPDFSLKDAQGKSHQLSEYHGKVVVLEWTCPECPFVQRHYQQGTMKELAGSFADTNVVWLAVNTSHYNKAEDSLKWTKEQELSYPTLLDSDGAVGRLYDAKTTPHMFVIDPQGKLVYNGAIDDDPQGKKEMAQRVNYVKGAVHALLAGKEVSVSETKPYGCSVKYSSK